MYNVYYNYVLHWLIFLREDGLGWSKRGILFMFFYVEYDWYPFIGGWDDNQIVNNR